MTLSFQSMEDAVHLRICFLQGRPEVFLVQIGEDRSLEDDRRCMCVWRYLFYVWPKQSWVMISPRFFAFHFGADFANPIWCPYVIYTVKFMKLDKGPVLKIMLSKMFPNPLASRQTSHVPPRLREADQIVEGSKQQRSISIRNFELAWFLEEFRREILLGNFQSVEKTNRCLTQVN